MIRCFDDLVNHVKTFNPEIIYLSEREYCNVIADPKILQIERPEGKFTRFMNRPILLKPALTGTTV